MSKRAPSPDRRSTAKRARMINDKTSCQPLGDTEDYSPLQDDGAWKILEDFLTTDMTFPQMEEKLESYLGGRYCEMDWKDARDALFSGDGDDTLALENLHALKAKYMATSLCLSRPSASSCISDSSSITASSLIRMPVSEARVRTLRRGSGFNPFINIEADDGDEEADEDGDDVSDSGNMMDKLHLPVQFSQVTSSPGPSAKDKLAASIDGIIQRYQESPIGSLQSLHASGATSSPLPGTLLQSLTSERRLYRLRVQKSATDYIANHLRKRGFEVIVSTWVSSDLYVSADSPKSISESLPPSHAQAVVEYLRISEEEYKIINNSSSTIRNPAWVKIKRGVYNNDIGYVFDSDQTNGFVAVLIPPRNFPYHMPQYSVALLDRSRLPHDESVSDILREEQVMGFSYKGEQYYKGLLLKHFRSDHLEVVDCPHIDDIRLHLQSGWDSPFLEKAKVVFSLQFLRAGDAVRVIRGDLCTCVATVTSVNQIYRSVTLEFVSDGETQQTQVRLEDVERVFHVGDTVRVVAGSHLGLKGYIVEMSEEMFHVCQGVSGEQVEVSKYYLDHCGFDHRFSSTLPLQPSSEASPDDDIQIGDHIKVSSGEHNGKHGTVRWLDGRVLWFIDETHVVQNTKFDLATLGIRVPVESVQRLHFPNVLKFTKERGYDVKPRDKVMIARGPHYDTTGTVQSVDFPNASLKLKCDSNNTLIDVPIRFAIMQNPMSSSEKFNTFIGKEVFVIAGDYKGYRGTLLDISPELCHVAMHAHPRLTLKRLDVVTQYGTRLNGVILDSASMATFCEMRAESYVRTAAHRSVTPPPPTQAASSRNFEEIQGSSGEVAKWSVNPWTANLRDIRNLVVSHERGSSAFDPWTVNHQDTLDNLEQRVQDPQGSAYNGPLSWLMNKEFSSILHNYHAILKVSVNFMGGRLSKRFVSTACPDPFCGKNGPAPQGFVAVFCTSNTAGAAIQHYNIPVEDLSPAPPRKKQQYCLIFDGPCRGQVGIITKCNSKNNTIAVNGIVDLLHFNQICLVAEATM